MQISESALDQLVYYVHERQSIFLKKEAGEPRPWTTDPIFQKFKFTNVLRSDDWTTRQLVKNWYEPHADAPLEEILLNCAIARYFGTWEFCQAIGWQTVWQPHILKHTAELRMARKLKVFTPAYVITNGGISDKKYNVVVDHYLGPFHRNIPAMVHIAEASGSFEQLAKFMMKLPGFGGTGFMSKEVISDFILATKHRIKWQDLETWSPVGPGARLGLVYMLGLPSTHKLNDKAALTALRAVAAALAPRLAPHMPQFGEAFDLHSVQFLMCELRKYVKVGLGEGFPKNTYNPRIK